MSRRLGLPGASELFRDTGGPQVVEEAANDADASGVVPSGRIRHEEKITVYVSMDELLALEQARLTIRGSHGVAADRGRIVRTAIGLAVADLAARGADSDLVRRLGEP